jgi:hypothetical protein
MEGGMFQPGVPALNTAKHSPSCLAESRSRNLLLNGQRAVGEASSGSREAEEQ